MRVVNAVLNGLTSRAHRDTLGLSNITTMAALRAHIRASVGVVGDTPEGKVMAVHVDGDNRRREHTRRRKWCRHCGKQDHDVNDCQFDTPVCFLCQQPGHRQRNCPRRRRRRARQRDRASHDDDMAETPAYSPRAHGTSVPADDGRGQRARVSRSVMNSMVVVVDDARPDVTTPTGASVMTTQVLAGDPHVAAVPHVLVKVGDEPAVALVDSGASTSMVATSFVNLVDNDEHSVFELSTPLRVTGVWNQTRMLTQGVNMAVTLGSQRFHHRFVVAPNGHELPGGVAFVLGCDFITRHGVDIRGGEGGQAQVMVGDTPVQHASPAMSVFATRCEFSSVTDRACAGDLKPVHQSSSTTAVVHAATAEADATPLDSDSEDDGYSTPPPGDVAGMLHGMDAAFSQDALDIGDIDPSIVSFHIDTGDAKPQRVRRIPASPPAKRIITAHVLLWMLAGCVERARDESAWSAPTVLVPKKDVTADGVVKAITPSYIVTDEMRERDRRRVQQVERVLRMPHGPRRRKLSRQLAAELAEIVKGTRLCVNYRALNSVTVTDAAHIKSAEEIFCELPPQPALISVVDWKSGFNAVRVAPDSIPKTTFSTPIGQMHMLRLGFGFKNAPMAIARAGDIVLAGTTAKIYVDDVAIVSQQDSQDRDLIPGLGYTRAEWRRHCRQVRQVLRACIRYGVKLHKEKSKFAVLQADYVNRNISPEGLRKRGDHLPLLARYPSPRNKGDVATFLGLAGYFRDFVPHFAEEAAILSDLKPASVKFTWTDEHEAAMRRIINIILSDVVLQIPDFSKCFHLQTDASNISIGGTLMQMDKEGRLRPLQFISRKLTAAERKWSVKDRELLAIVWAVKKWSMFLRFAKFTVWTDHRNLAWLLNQQQHSGRVERWLLGLMSLAGNMTIRYKPGVQNPVADALSRVEIEQSFVDVLHAHGLLDIPDDSLSLGTDKLITPPSHAATVKGSTTMTTGDATPLTMAAVEATLLLAPVHVVPTMDELVCAQREDPKLAGLVKRLEEHGVDELPIRELVRPPHYKEWVLKLDATGCLVAVAPDATQRAVVPPSLQQAYVAVAHDDHGHLGQKATIAKLRRRLFWPNLSSDVQAFIQQCVTCRRTKSTSPAKQGLMQPYFCSQPRDVVHLDIVGPLVVSTQGYKYILTMRCRFSRWTAAAPLSSITAEAVCDVFLREWIYRYGTPRCIITDRGTQFTSSLLAGLCKKLGVKQRFTSSWHPQTNQVERSHRDIVRLLAARLQDVEHDQWPDHLGLVMFALNTTPSTTTGYSPFELWFGYPAVTTFSMVATSALPPAESHHEYLERFQQRLTTIHDAADEAQRRQANNNKLRYDADHVAVHFNPGDRVLVRDFRANATKLDLKFSKPATIVKRLSPLLYEVVFDPRDRRRRQQVKRIHVQRILLFKRHHDRDDDNDIVAPEPMQVPGDVKKEEELEVDDAVAGTVNEDAKQEEPVLADAEDVMNEDVKDEASVKRDVEEVEKQGHGDTTLQPVILRSSLLRASGLKYLVLLPGAKVLMWLDEEQVPISAVKLFKTKAKTRDRAWRAEARRLEQQYPVLDCDPDLRADQDQDE